MICDFKEEMAWHHMRKAWVSYTQSVCPILLNAIKLCPNLVELTPLLKPSMESVLRDLCPRHLCFGGVRDWLWLSPTPINSWGQPPAQFNARKRQPISPRPLHSLSTIVWEMVEQNVQPHPSRQGCSAPQALPGTPGGFSPEQGSTRDGFHNGQSPQNLLLS